MYYAMRSMNRSITASCSLVHLFLFLLHCRGCGRLLFNIACMAQCPDLVSRPLTYLPPGLTDHISELFVLDSHTTAHSQARMVFDIIRSMRGSLTMPINHSPTRLKAAGCDRRRAQPPQGVATPTSAEHQATLKILPRPNTISSNTHTPINTHSGL